MYNKQCIQIGSKLCWTFIMGRKEGTQLIVLSESLYVIQTLQRFVLRWITDCQVTTGNDDGDEKRIGGVGEPSAL